MSTAPTQTVLLGKIYSFDVLQMLVREDGLVSAETLLQRFATIAPTAAVDIPIITNALNTLVAGGVVAKVNQKYCFQLPMDLQTDRRFNDKEWQRFTAALDKRPDWNIDNTPPVVAVMDVLSEVSLDLTDPRHFKDEEIFVLMWLVEYRITWKGLMAALNQLIKEKALIEVPETGCFHLPAKAATPKRKESTAMAITKIQPLAVAQGPQLKIDTALMRTVSDTYLEGDTFDLPRINAECKGLLANVMLNTIQLGRRLCAVKAVLGHGPFMEWLANESGLPMDQRNANRYMAIGQAVTERPELARLGTMGVSKACLLLSMPEEQVEEMASKGTVNGQPLDELEAMTRKELLLKLRTMRKQLTETKQDREATVEELHHTRVELHEAKAALGDLALKKPSQIEQELQTDMDAFKRLVSAKLNYYKAIDTSKISDDTQLQLKALGEYVGNAADAMVLTLREKMSSSPTLSRHGQVTGMDWQELEERQKQVASYWHD